MATGKLFWIDPYRTTLETHVSGVEGDEISLVQTIFYALSGGQESDAGTIAGFPVLEARKDGQALRYRLPPDHGLNPGASVRIEIDGVRRLRLMRLHFAAELTLELVTRRLPDVEKIGAHIAADKARIDFALESSVAPMLDDLTRSIAEIIELDLPIESDFSDQARERRFWRIDGFAAVPCGGTHLKRTGEVGAVSLRRKNIGRGKERIEIFVAD
jgi:Ser-tRNA(Ala) deacylase AlaX